MGKISLTNIAEELAAKGAIGKEAADNFIRAMVETIEKGLREDKVVKIKGLGTFKLMEVSDRGSVDINTGERITIKGHRKVSFTPDSAMKEFVNRPFSHFEPTELNDGYPEEEVNPDDDNVEETEQNETVTSDESPMSVISEVVPESSILPSIDTDANSVEDVEQSGVQDELEDVVNALEVYGVTPSDLQTNDEVVESPQLYGEKTEENKPNLEETLDNIAVEVAESLNEVELEGKTETLEPLVESEDAPCDNEVQETEPQVKSEEEAETELKSKLEPERMPEKGHVDAPSEKSSESVNGNIVAETEKTKVSNENKSKHSGCGWFIVILLIALACGVYYIVSVDQDESMHNYDEQFKEYNDMMVNPNLEEELGKEWADEPKVETQLPVVKKDTTIVSKAPTGINNAVSQTTVSAPTSEKKVVEETEKLFCAVLPTQSLEAKSVKDITPADTTDYIIDGTLVTHELKSGETIIQLAKRYYGDKRLWPYIVKYNWMKDYNNVAIGQMINIPVLKDKK